MLEPEEQVSVFKLSTSSKPSAHGLDASGALAVDEDVVQGLCFSTVTNDSSTSMTQSDSPARKTTVERSPKDPPSKEKLVLDIAPPSVVI